MKKLILAALAAGVTITAVAPAMAADGCGRGYHRGPRGGCRPNMHPGAMVVAPGLVIGNFYRGQGYWDGHRYWHNRYRQHGGWRYR
jgi:hypothetical protein